MIRFRILLVYSVFIALLLACGSDHSRDLADVVIPDHPSFNFDIRPILSNNCYLCHGPDISTREADLRLDLEEGLTASLEGGKQVIVPGSPQKSELFRRISAHDEDVVMPPPSTKRTLSDREVALVSRWIEQGAKWEPYWAFIPPEKSENTELSDASDPEAIDFLLNEQLTKRSVEAAAPAAKPALVRRLSYILCGLPPHVLGIDHLTGSVDTDWYETLVDTLMSRPQFGERWARHWMDLMRYAEGKGHEFDYPIIGAWQYRDYLIRAFNADLPYDQLVREHLAGDLIDPPRVHPDEKYNESVLATIHYRMSEGKHSPVDIKDEESDRIDNIIDVTTKTFQAMTVSCAQCHDHKFDPIPTADYYSLYGIFESTRQVVRKRVSMEELASTETNVVEVSKYLRKEVETALVQAVAQPQALQINGTSRAGGEPDEPWADFRDGGMEDWEAQGIVKNSLGNVTSPDGAGRAMRISGGSVSSEALPGQFAAFRSPTFILEHDSILINARGKNANIRLVIDNFQLIQNPIYGELEIMVDTAVFSDFLIPVAPYLGHKAYLEIHTGQYFRHNLSVEPDAFFALQHVSVFDSNRVARELSFNGNVNPTEALDRWRKDEASAGDVHTLNRILRRERIAMPSANSLPRLPAPGDSLLYQAVQEGDAVFSPIFIRGSHTQLADTAESHRFLSAVPSPEFPQTGSGRKAFADALVSPSNPLTSRVMVNRIWHHIFGRGLVETVDNFGLQGKAPTHPELLDHLAVRFMEEGWSIKKVIRAMVLTSAFQRSTMPSEDLHQVDPQNLLLRHFPIRRLEAEAIRDGILATSGSLSPKMYGPSVPLFLDEFLRGRGRPSVSGPLDGGGRRSLYQAIPRNFLPPMMLTYDMPAPFSAFGRRNVSNVPAQSLTLMNDPFVAQESQRWATRLLAGNQDFEGRVANAMRMAFSRELKPGEIEFATQFFVEQSKIYGLEPADGRLNVSVWADYLHSLFMMKEFIFLI